MSKNIIELSPAINLSNISSHPAEAIIALVEVVKRQEQQIAHLEENQEIQASIIAKLRGQMIREPSEFQQDRSEILRALLVSHGGKMLAKEARQKMRVSKTIFSRILATMKDEIEIRPLHTNHKYHLLVLRSTKDG